MNRFFGLNVGIFIPVVRRIFPVTSPVISLLRFQAKAIYLSVYAEIHGIRSTQQPKIPVNFPVNGNFKLETG